MAKLTSNINSSLLNTGMGTLSKLVPTETITTNETLSKTFSINGKTFNDIKDSIEKEGFRKEEPIVIAQLKNGTVLGVADGHTRLKAAKELGLEEVYVTYRTFESLEEAQQYTKDRQFKRRNLSQAEIYEYASELENVEEKTGEGRATERLAKEIGVSASTIEHARTVASRADEETQEKIKNNEMSINQAYQTVRKSKKKQEEDTNEDDSNNDDFDDISDSLSDNSGTPQGLNFNHSDGIERPNYTVHPEDDTDRWIKEKNIQVESARKEGLEEGLKKGSDLAYEVYEYILSEIENGKSADLRNDEKFEDFSVMKIYKAFGISECNKSGIYEPQEE